MILLRLNGLFHSFFLLRDCFDLLLFFKDLLFFYKDLFCFYIDLLLALDLPFLLITMPSRHPLIMLPCLGDLTLFILRVCISPLLVDFITC